MKKSLLIFDLDGTLLDSVPDLAAAINLALNDLTLPACQLENVRRYVGNGAYKLCQRALNEHSPHADGHDLDRLYARFIHHYTMHTCHHSQPYAGVNDGLKQLRAHGFTLALATNKPAAFVPKILDAFCWHDFALWLGGDSLAHKKPHPEPLLHICHTLSVAPAQAVMIGDSKNDILAGKAAQMSTLALSYGYNHGEPIHASLPDAVFDHFDELVAYVLDSFA